MMTMRSGARRFMPGVDKYNFNRRITLTCTMARIFITGSSDGLGRMAASLLVEEGHEVTLHARNERRGKDAMAAVKGAKGVLTGDLSDIEETKQLAEKIN